MSENKHTPEPWAIDPDDRPNMHWNNHIVSEANPNIAICFMAHDGTEQNERGEANARRIVACVNACAGIDTELLEIIADNDKTLAGVIANVEKQRDELLAALETHATKDVIAERRRQQIVEGWTTDHDDQHKNGEMPRAAGLYAISAGFASKYMDGETKTCPVPDGWPWGPEWWKPANSRRDLVKAAALILAEIERIDRAAIAIVKGINPVVKESLTTETAAPAIVFYPAGSLGEEVHS